MVFMVKSVCPSVYQSVWLFPLHILIVISFLHFFFATVTVIATSSTAIALAVSELFSIHSCSHSFTCLFLVFSSNQIQSLRRTNHTRKRKQSSKTQTLLFKCNRKLTFDDDGIFKVLWHKTKNFSRRIYLKADDNKML